MGEGLAAGDRVEVRRRLDAHWARGFEVAEVEDDRVRVRRLSDGELLPIALPVEDVRKERRGDDFWWM